MTVPIPNDKLLKQALEWFFLLQSDNCNAEDHQRFDRWFSESEENRTAYLYAESLWLNMNQITEQHVIPGLEEARKLRPRKHSLHVLSVSALLLAASALTALGWTEYHAETVTYSTIIGERRTVTLNDGSIVDMNTTSRLHVRLSLLQRKMTLEEGEAVFDVQHEDFRPFNVYAGQLKIRDIGTRFNVRLYPDAVSVAVLEGAVEINNAYLGEGYQRTYYTQNDLAALQPIDIDQVESWRHGRLVFKQATLQEITVELTRYHSVQFVFTEPSVAQKTLSGTFNSGDLALFLNSIERLLPVEVNYHPDTQIVLIGWKSKR